MSGSLNKVILIGNLGQDPKSSVMQNGNSVVSFSIATTETWKDKTSGERKDKTEWHRIVIFNPNLATVASRYLQKGSKVYLEGSLQTRKYTDKDGLEKQTTEIVLSAFNGTLIMLDSKGSNTGGYDNTPAEHTTTKEADWKPNQNTAIGNDLDDEIPF